MIRLPLETIFFSKNGKVSFSECNHFFVVVVVLRKRGCFWEDLYPQVLVGPVRQVGRRRRDVVQRQRRKRNGRGTDVRDREPRGPEVLLLLGGSSLRGHFFDVFSCTKQIE